MTLYQLKDEYLNALNSIEVNEDGEIENIDQIESVKGEFEDKAEAVAIYIKSLIAEADAVHNELKNLKDREDRLRNKAERLTDYLAYNIKQTGAKNFKTSKVVVSSRISKSCNVFDEFAVPEMYMKTTVTKKPDKTAITAAIKSGVKVNGAELVEKENWSVK